MTTKQGETHTPGPWHVRPPTAQNPSRAITSALSGGVVIYDAPLTAETEANARLIAAAPHLLTACEEVLAWYEDQIYDGKPDPACIGEVRAAIKKARGG